LFNKQESIRGTIESVLAQTYQDFELIIVNDGSTDQSLERARVIEDPRIRIISQANAGECAARNRGIKEARCEVVAFLDADDEWLPGFLEKIIHLREAFPTCKVYATGFAKVSSDPSKYKEKVSPFPAGWEGVLEDLHQILITYTPFNASSIAVDKECLLLNGGFKEKVLLRGDMELWVRLSMSVHFAYSNEVLSLYLLDAENRVCEVHKDEDFFLGEHLLTLDSYLKKGKVPKRLRNGAKTYLSFSLLNTAAKNLQVKNQNYALRMLIKWQYYRPHFRRWLRLMVLCFRPTDPGRKQVGE